MAVSDAVRRSGSLLLRALAVGGLATATWLVCAGVASASADDLSDELATALDAVNLKLDEPQAAGELPAALLASFPVVELTAADDPAPQYSTADFTYRPATNTDPRPLTVPVEFAYQPTDPEYAADAEDDSFWVGGTEYSHSGYSHNGTVSNTMPAPLYEAKVAAKAAVRAAAAAALAPPAPRSEPAPPAEPAPTRVVESPAPEAPFAPTFQLTPAPEVTWQAPEPSAPVPAPKQAPAPSAPTASSGSMDNGGGHRGGLIASFTSQSGPKPPTAWSAERRDDGRSPGSIPGLPSTSPD